MCLRGTRRSKMNYISEDFKWIKSSLESANWVLSSYILYHIVLY